MNNDQTTNEANAVGEPPVGDRPAAPAPMAPTVSSQATARWSVARMKRKNGPVYPIRLTFGQPMTEPEVLAYIKMERSKRSEAYRQFNHFEVWPTPA